MLQKIRDVFQHNERRSLLTQNPQEVSEHIPIAFAIESELLTRLRERLTRESSAKDVVIGDAPRHESADIVVGNDAEISLIESPQARIDLTRKDATNPKPLQTDVESAKPGEKVHHFHAA